MKIKEHMPGELDGILSPYLRNKRRKAVIPFIIQKKSILDIGCGIFLWKSVFKDNVEYIGIDIEESIIKHNIEHFNHIFTTVDIENEKPLQCGMLFDIILMLAVFEHFKDPGKVLINIYPLLKEQGLVCITTPHNKGKILMNIGAKIKLFSQDKHQHHKLFNREEISKLAKMSGFRVVNYKKFLYGFNQLVILEKKYSSKF